MSENQTTVVITNANWRELQEKFDLDPLSKDVLVNRYTISWPEHGFVLNPMHTTR